MEIRAVKREEIKDISNIDRSEAINQFYYYQNNKLILKNKYCDVSG